VDCFSCDAYLPARRFDFAAMRAPKVKASKVKAVPEQSEEEKRVRRQTQRRTHAHTRGPCSGQLRPAGDWRTER
jgi:hypothetical protein